VDWKGVECGALNLGGEVEEIEGDTFMEEGC
jgi:hypothetical protein